MKILLLQARSADDPAKLQELRSFALKMDLEEEQVVPHDLLGGPPTLAEVRAHDAMMIGGSGDYYVSKGNLPHADAFSDLLREVVEIGHPTFASCFGFQCIVQALGGEIVHDPANTEVGTYELKLTVDGQSDPLLGDLPCTFLAQMGRKDRASRLPDGVLHLASSERAPFQALRIPGRPIWASQFHPELDRSENKLRYAQYLDGYSTHLSQEEQEKALNGFTESSPQVLSLLSRFLELISE